MSKKPILLVQTTKVNANKPLIRTSNEEQNPIESSSSVSTIPPKDSLNSLRKQIRDQSKCTFQQSHLIEKLHSDLVRAELQTGNHSPNSNIQENTDQYSNLATRLDYLVDTYISQHEKLKKIESGTLEQQSNTQINELNHQIIQLKADIENQNNQIRQLTDQLHERSDETKLMKSFLFALKKKAPTSISFYNLNDYTFDSAIDSGSTSNVNAVYKKEKYAKKELKELTFDQFKKFMSECEILFKLHHPCIIRIYGFNNGDETHAPSMILSLEHISLERAIHDSLLDNHQKNRIIVEIVLGMRYIHKHNIMHRDLKPLNILLSKNMHVRISDFGLAKVEDIEITQSKGIGTVRFMAPELFVNEDDDDDEEENKVKDKNVIGYTNKVDVYSFGISLIYIVTEKYPPFKMKEAVTGVIPKIKGPIVEWVRELIVRCLSISPDERPSFAEIFEIIKSHDYDLFNDEKAEDHEFKKKEIEKRILKIEAFEYQHQNE